MKFTCENYLLQSACVTASRATAGKSAIPALEGLLIKADGEITVTGYDLKKGIYTSFEADIKENGSIVVNSKLFGEIIRKLPDGIVSMTADENNNVNIKCGMSEYNFMGISSEDYPEMPSVEEENSINLKQGILKSMTHPYGYALRDKRE